MRWFDNGLFDTTRIVPANRPAIAVLRSTFFVALLCLPNPNAARAQPTSFPYEAVVVGEQVEVRSGPGRRYYVTGTAQRGERLTVHRHDLGGWLMVAPPKGSFSYIAIEHVRQISPERGVVQVQQAPGVPAARAVVRIGSSLSKDYAYSGRQLATGETVDILGRVTLPTDNGALEFYKIEPPQREFRWVKGDHVVPASEAGNGLPSEGPIASPSNAPVEQPAAVADEIPIGDPFADSSEQPQLDAPHIGRFADNSSSVRPSGPSRAELEADRRRLAELDDRYRSMVADDPRNWDVDGLRSDYEQLQQDAASTAMVGRVEQRLAALEKRARQQTEYVQFLRLTEQTSQREADLLTMQNRSSVQASSSTEVRRAPAAAPRSQQSQPTPQRSQSGTPPRDLRSMLSGAGIVQTAFGGPAGAPNFLLTSPDGRVLAWLRPAPGMDLQKFVGREAGLIGPRRNDPKLGGDVIDVKRVIAVRLKK